jgi:hypothetical protein
MDSEQYHSMYAEADEQFRSAGSESEMVSFFHTVHGKLGKVKESTLRSYQEKWFPGQGSLVVLLYETRFSKGTGTENV